MAEPTTKANPVPYEGAGTSLRVQKAVNYVQLVEELHKVLPAGVDSVGHVDDITKAISAENGLTLHFSDAVVDVKRLAKVVEDHVPNVYHGLNEAQVEAAKLKERLVAGSDLALKDLNKIVRSLLKRV